MSREEVIHYLGTDWDRVLDLIRGRLHSDVGLLEETNDRIFSNSGKMLRPLISLLVAKALSEPTQDSLRFAAATELFHNATLLHDDVADESAQRRGSPTVAALLGPSAAVLVGDYWLARAVELVVDTERRDAAIRVFSRTLIELAEGEMLQLEKASSADTTQEDYLRIIHCKTASLFCASAQAAAVSVEATPEQFAAAQAFGEAFGTAFQIKDDILDYAGTDVLGKPVGVDLKERKITLPLLGALEGSPREAEIREMVREIHAHPEYCGIIRRFVLERDGIGYAVRILGHWVERAVEALEVFPEGPAKEALAGIARYNVWREV